MLWFYFRKLHVVIADFCARPRYFCRTLMVRLLNLNEFSTDFAWLVVALPNSRTDNLCVRKSQLSIQLSFRPRFRIARPSSRAFFMSLDERNCTLYSLNIST